MNAFRLAVLTSLALALSMAASLSCSGADAKREVCANGLDDDGNGLVDCLDPDCAGQPACTSDGGYFGPCQFCGRTCTEQPTCFEQKAVLERPPPLCNAGRCEALNFPIQVNFNIDLQAYNGIDMGLFGSMSIRFVLKKAIDGSAVSCAALEQATNSTDGGIVTDAETLEKVGRFNVLGIDAYPLQKQPTLPVKFVNTGTGSDFLIWIETWAGPRDPSTKLPTGRRIGIGCVESGPGVAPLTAADDCNPLLFPDGGNPNCRTIDVSMPAPQ